MFCRAHNRYESSDDCSRGVAPKGRFDITSDVVLMPIETKDGESTIKIHGAERKLTLRAERHEDLLQWFSLLQEVACLPPLSLCLFVVVEGFDMHRMQHAPLVTMRLYAKSMDSAMTLCVCFPFFLRGWARWIRCARRCPS